MGDHTKSRQSSRVVLAAVALLLCAFAVPAAEFADPEADVARVYELIDARLNLMPHVAAYKWRNARPILDEVREQALLEKMSARARDLGLAPQSVQAVFDVQLQIARAIQSIHFETWRENGLPADIEVRELENDLRPALDDLSERQVSALYWAREQLNGAHTGDAVGKVLRRIASIRGVTAQDLSRLRNALSAIRAENPKIDTIEKLGVLRIGTTGDYAPFSVEQDGELRGADIELAESLALSLGLTPRFVRTSWPRLMEDLEAQRFDIAVGGISNTPERAARAEFSTAYHFDGKTPIARCDDRARFDSLEEIDQPQVRVIVNPGGTNEQFVRDHIKHAQVIVHADNRTVFDELVAHRADVMITDGIEVELQTKRQPMLCRTMSDTLTRAAKAILLPRGFAAAEDIDRWLQAEIARGAVSQRLQRAMQAESHGN